MKRKAIQVILGAVVAAAGVFAPAGALWAEETEVAAEAAFEETEAVTEAVVSETEAKAEMPDIQCQTGETVVTIKNETGIEVSEFTLGVNPDGGEDTKEDYLVIKEAGGREHILEQVDFSEAADPVLIEDNGFFYINYTNAAGEKKTFSETAEEIELEEPVTLYVVNTVYMRSAADSESEILAVADLGAEVTAVGAAPKWYHVQYKDQEGYISRAYLSRSEEDAQQALSSEAAEQARIQAAAAAAAAAAAQNASSGSGSSGKTVVSKQKYLDCDGSGHGYYEIIYSDGSTAIEEF